MERKTKFIGIGSQKGGVGKSTVVTVLASYLFYTKGFNLIVIDCDYPQYSISQLRKREKEELEADPLKLEKVTAHFKEFGKKSYSIVEAKATTALKEAENAMETSLLMPDLILFDLPGSIDVPGVLSLSLELDFIFTPILPDMQTLESSLTYVQLLRDQGVFMSGSPLEQVWLFWNRVDGREKTKLIDYYSLFLQEEGFGILRSFLPASVRFNKESAHNDGPVFRSTYYPPDKKLLKDSNIEALAYEITSIIFKK